MHSAQRLGWLSSRYSSTLATKLDGAQGKAGRLVKDETVQSERCCVLTERVVQSSRRCGEWLTQRIRYSCKGLYTDDGVFVAILSCSARRSSPKGIVVSETSSGKSVKRKVTPT
ncbi:hypothetical protein BHM03_00016936 [Ensete ventricosum]|nr:hypothetical protein BHM03_00016936 [Ensete ventricosum]